MIAQETTVRSGNLTPASKRDRANTLFEMLIIAAKSEQIRELALSLARSGFNCSVATSPSEVGGQVARKTPDLVLIAMNSPLMYSEVWHLWEQVRQKRALPVIALISKGALGNFDPGLKIDDFVVEPWDIAEVAARAKRVLWRINKVDCKELIGCGDLVIDLGKCEVSVGGRLVSLTFREYELLRFLAANEGRVFTRDALLNEVWGYDYYGGDRTVDVHIRRLRSKIEDPAHIFIETVRNIGYRFRKDS